MINKDRRSCKEQQPNVCETSAHICAVAVPKVSRALREWIERQRSAGLLTPEVEEPACQLVCALDCYARGRHPIIRESISTLAAQLAAAHSTR